MEEELDPLLKAQVDGEVEEFRRRLEAGFSFIILDCVVWSVRLSHFFSAAGQSTKAKLTPIFYVDEKKRSTFLRTE